MILEDLAFLMHKDNKYYEPLLLGSPSISLTIRLVFIIIYIIICAILYRISSKYGGGFGRTAKIFLFLGFCVGFFIMVVEDLLDFSVPAVIYDDQTKKLIVTGSWEEGRFDDSSWWGGPKDSKDRKTAAGGAGTLNVLIKDNVGLFENQRQRDEKMLVTFTKNLERLVREKKIKIESFEKWAQKQEEPNIWTDKTSNITALDVNVESLFWKTALNHCIYLLSHTLTLAYIIGHWEINVFKSIFIWIATAASLEIIMTLSWIDVQTFLDRKHALYVIKKSQLISSGLALIAIFGFIGKTAFRK